MTNTKSTAVVAKGYRVRQIKGRAEHIGRIGTVTLVGGFISGDQLVQVRTDEGDLFECYTRQIETIGNKGR